jgi:hypothetical protein
MRLAEGLCIFVEECSLEPQDFQVFIISKIAPIKETSENTVGEFSNSISFSISHLLINV